MHASQQIALEDLLGRAFDDPDPDELATTGKFVRSYEPPAWFEPSDEALLAIEDPAPTTRHDSWWWLAISLAAAGVAVAAMACL